MQTRRAMLGAVGVAVGGIAGCGQPEGGGSPTTTSSSTEANGATGTESPTAGSSSDLDLREANVVGVSFEQVEDGRYRFDVTLIHDDDGEDGYANWWQVEALDGDQFGRRNLSHAHGTTEFTRSTTVDVPADQPCVVVRGHDQTHGYGGQAMLLSLDAESVVPKRQGSDPQSFTEADCPD